MATTVTILGITGGEDLSGLDYVVFDGQDVQTMAIIDQGINATTNANGDLTLDISASGATNGQSLLVVIGDWTAIPTAASNVAVCYADAVVV